MAILDVPVPQAPATAPRTAELASQPFGVGQLRVRPLDPSTDGTRLLAMCPSVSPQSLYQRFFTSFHRLPPPLLALLLDVDHDRREALVVLDADDIVAVARYASVLDPPDEADVSILVVDRWQRRGLATRLFQLLNERASARGIATFTATVLLENRQARGLMASVWPEASAHYVDGASTYRFPLGPAEPDPARTRYPASASVSS
jgi:GNAT superfamily N-acetyltransferase